MRAIRRKLQGLFTSEPKLTPETYREVMHHIPDRATRDIANAHSDALPAAQAEIKQLKFLLASAPMIEVPVSPTEAREFASRAGSRFAYIHPHTMAKITFEPVRGHFMILGRSKTKWVLTSLMPKERVIFSPLAIPGIEKILAG